MFQVMENFSVYIKLKNLLLKKWLNSFLFEIKRVINLLKALSTTYNSLKIRILDYSIAFFMFISKTVIPIKKCLI